MCYYKGYEGATCRFFSECHDGLICKYGRCEPEEPSSSTTESGSSFLVVLGIVILILFAILAITFFVVKVLRKKDPGTQTNTLQ
jgi:hypothetical protein